MTGETPTVLVVDDERDLADLYAAWLADEYEVRMAYGGEEAIEEIDETVDVALVDRLMPQTSGGEVVEHIREEGYDCSISMVTAVEPDFDIVAMGFDDYLVKPVSREALEEAVSKLLLRDEYAEGVRELFSLASKKALLEAEKSVAELEGSNEYADLSARIEEYRDRLEELRGELDRTADDLSERDFEVELRQLNSDG